jgi:hypothetical protein
MCGSFERIFISAPTDNQTRIVADASGGGDSRQGTSDQLPLFDFIGFDRRSISISCKLAGTREVD